MNYSIRPTKHYLIYYSDVDWKLVLRTILSPNKTRLEPRARLYTYVKAFTKFVIEVHCEFDDEKETIWVINAFRMEK